MSDKKQILIVDDEEHIILTLKLRLEHLGYDVITAADGQEGLDTARSHHPDLIILDVMMPKMDGYKVCKLLKFDENFQSTPIILLSALSQQADIDLAMEIGADTYLTKPFDSQELTQTIERLLAK